MLEIAKNRCVVKHIADAILVCGTQSIALGVHRDDNTADPHSNEGTFLDLLHYGVIRSGDTVLAIPSKNLQGMQLTLVRPSKIS